MKEQSNKVESVKVEPVVVVANKTEPSKKPDGWALKEMIAKYGNKSKAIRALSDEGKSRGDIAKMLGLRYQHVRNVLITPIKKQSEAAPTTA